MFTSTQHPHETGGPRALVAYASKHGSTAEIAEAVTFELRRTGVEVDCLAADAVSDADHYDAIVLGSAVYMGRWRREGRRFLDVHADTLARVPFWIFSTGPVGKSSGSADRWEEPRKILAIAGRLGMRDHFVFGGRVPQDPGNFVERAMLRGTPEESADLRDWDEIRARSREIGTAIASSARGTRSPIRS